MNSFDNNTNESNINKNNVFVNIEDFLVHIEKRAFVMARVATGDKEEALDIVQDAMIKLVSSYSNKASNDWPPLFHRIMQNKINDWYRKQKVRNTWRRWLGNDSSDEGEFRDSLFLENKSNDQDRLPEQELNSMEFSESLEKALTILPMRQKQAFMLRAWEEMSTKETSKIMSCSEGSVKTHYSRALASLRNNLKQDLEGLSL